MASHLESRLSGSHLGSRPLHTSRPLSSALTLLFYFAKFFFPPVSWFFLLLSFILSLFFSQINSSLETYFPDTSDKHHREKVFPTMRSLSGHDVKCQGVRCLRKVPVQDFPLTSCIFLETQYCWGLTFLIFKIKQAGLPLSCSNYFLNLQNPFLKENHMRNIKMEKILKKSFSGSIGEWGK